MFSDHPTSQSCTPCAECCVPFQNSSLEPRPLVLKKVLSNSSSNMLFLCNSCKLLTVTFHSLLIIFHSRASTSTSAILLLGSTTSCTLNRGEFLSLDSALIFWFRSYTWHIPCISLYINEIYNAYSSISKYLRSNEVAHSERQCQH